MGSIVCILLGSHIDQGRYQEGSLGLNTIWLPNSRDMNRDPSLYHVGSGEMSRIGESVKIDAGRASPESLPTSGSS
jgi:hypothetical protein